MMNLNSEKNLLKNSELTNGKKSQIRQKVDASVMEI